MELSKESDAPGFCWIVGCALPTNAISVCKYLFDRSSNRLKPQLKSSLVSCQLYSAALSNLFHSDKTTWKSFSVIYKQLKSIGFGWLPEIKQLSDVLESAFGKNEFCQETHVAFIKCLMMVSITKLASSENLEQEIRRLEQEHPHLRTSVDFLNSRLDSTNSADFIEKYGRLIQTWLITAAHVVIPEIVKHKEVDKSEQDLLISRLGFISLLSCAAYHYRSHIAKSVPPSFKDISQRVPVLEAHLAALATDPDPMQENSCLQDEQSNASCLFALLEGILGQGKGSGGRPDPPHLCLITAALCALPHFVGSTTAQFFNLAAICSAATLFHWFTGSEWSVSVLCDESCDKSQPSSQIIQSPIEVAQRNSAALRSLVRSSGGFAKKARPANPDSIPAALIDISTVEQLVSSTTSDPADPHTSADQHQDERLLDELACSAALAIVDSNGGNVSSGVQTIHVFPKLPYTSPSQEPDAGSLSMNSFFLNKNAEISSGSNFHRNPVYATFKMPSPSKEPTQSSIPRIESSSCINPSNADKSAPASPAQDVVSTTQSHTPQYNQLTSTQVSTPTSRSSWQRNAGRGKTNWSETASQRNEKRNRPATSTSQTVLPPVTTGKGATVLRLSLDQRRRAIEANRQRALREGDKVAADRHQAAFLALLHSSQRRRRQVAGEKDPSLVEEEDSEASRKENDEFAVNQSDLPSEESIEGVDYRGNQKAEQNSSFPQADVETTDMEDFSSICEPERSEVLSTVEPQESPCRSSSPPLESPADDIPTPRIKRRSSPGSSSSPSLPSDEPEQDELYSVSRRCRNLQPNHPQIARNHHRSGSRCSHCTAHDYYDSIPRRKPRDHRDLNGDGDLSRNGDFGGSYGTMPVRRVSKPRRCVVQQCRSMKNNCHGRGLSPDGSMDLHDSEGFPDDTASEIYWSTHAGSACRLRTSHHRLRQRHLDALDSGEELSYPVHGIDHPRRQYRLEANHLGKSTGTGLDVLAIAELARSVTTLRSDIERLTAQQQSLLAASRTDLHENRVRSTSQLDSAHSSSRLHLATTPTGSTRAMWSTRTPLRYPSQCDVQEQCTSPQEGCSVPVEPTNPIEAPQQNAPSPPIEKHSVNASLLESEPKEPQDDSVTKSLSSEPEVIKPAEKLFITFENPTSERLQRARERLEARRAADRSKLTESVIRARIADREAQFFEEVSQMSRKVQHLPPDSVPSTDPESDNSGFPVHTTIDGDTGRIAGAGAGNSATLPKSSRPNSARPRCPKTSTTLQQQNASTGQRLSRSSSLSRPNIRSSVTSSNGNRSIASASVTGGVNSTHGKRDAVSMNRQRSASRQSIGRLSNGPSLSSLHRSENGEESTHSGPGLPIAGIQPQTRLYVKPKSKSNRQVIVNAISHYCLAGAVNEPAKKAALQELASVDGSHFIVLFRDGRCQYRALYAFDFDTEELKLICGNGPRKITHSMCDKFYKYNSGAKQFSEITSTKHLSAVVDAITIQNSWWMRGPPLYSNAARIAAASVSAAHDDSRS